MSLSEINEINRSTQPDCKLFDELESSLWVEGRGRSYGKIQITVVAVSACRERAEEDCNDDRGMASQDLSNCSLNRGASFRDYVMGVAHTCSVITNGLQAQGKEGEVAGIVSVLAERAPSEGPRPTRAVEPMPATPLELGDPEGEDCKARGRLAGFLCSRNARSRKDEEGAAMCPSCSQSAQ